jgi:hypothetical protein
VSEVLFLVSSDYLNNQTFLPRNIEYVDTVCLQIEFSEFVLHTHARTHTHTHTQTHNYLSRDYPVCRLTMYDSKLVMTNNVGEK